MHSVGFNSTVIILLRVLYTYNCATEGKKERVKYHSQGGRLLRRLHRQAIHIDLPLLYPLLFHKLLPVCVV